MYLRLQKLQKGHWTIPYFYLWWRFGTLIYQLLLAVHSVVVVVQLVESQFCTIDILLIFVWFMYWHRLYLLFNWESASMFICQSSRLNKFIIGITYFVRFRCCHTIDISQWITFIKNEKLLRVNWITRSIYM